MANTKTAEELEMEWWQRWREQNFSWEGLKERKAPGTSGRWGGETLQDYWRHNSATNTFQTNEELLKAGELIEGPNGEHWHIVHMPTVWSNGEKTWKANLKNEKWGLLGAIISSRLDIAEKALRSINPKERPSPEYSHVQLQGAVLRDAVRHADGSVYPIYMLADRSATIGPANYFGSSFGPKTRLRYAAFFNRANFFKADFQGIIGIDSAIFFKGGNFVEANFYEITDFGNAIFLDDTNFDKANFHEEVDFCAVRFDAFTSFDNAVFNNIALFEQTLFENATFKNTNWQTGGSFKDAKVAKTPEFEGAKLHEDFSFDGAEFTCLDQNICHTQKIFRACLQLTAIAWIANWHMDGLSASVCKATSLISAFTAIYWFIFSGKNLNDAELERQNRAFRTLSRLCDEARNKRDAAKFYILELKAQRLRFGKGWREQLIKQPLERALSCAYDFFAGYGESISRPLFSLLIIVMGFATFFWIWEGGGLDGPNAPFWATEGHSLVGGDNVDPAYLEAITFSMSRIFPLGPWAESGAPCNFHNRLLLQSNSCRPANLKQANQREIERHRLEVKLLAMLETILGIALIFLFGLAIRRRFRIST